MLVGTPKHFEYKEMNQPPCLPWYLLSRCTSDLFYQVFEFSEGEVFNQSEVQCESHFADYLLRLTCCLDTLVLFTSAELRSA